MKNKIFGAIGIVWGGLILVRWALSGFPISEGAGGQGRLVGVGLGAALCAFGAYYFFKKPRPDSGKNA